MTPYAKDSMFILLDDKHTVFSFFNGRLKSVGYFTLHNVGPLSDYI